MWSDLEKLVSPIHWFFHLCHTTNSINHANNSTFRMNTQKGGSISAAFFVLQNERVEKENNIRNENVPQFVLCNLTAETNANKKRNMFKNTAMQMLIYHKWDLHTLYGFQIAHCWEEQESESGTKTVVLFAFVYTDICVEVASSVWFVVFFSPFSSSLFAVQLSVRYMSLSLVDLVLLSVFALFFFLLCFAFCWFVPVLFLLSTPTYIYIYIYAWCCLLSIHVFIYPLLFTPFSVRPLHRPACLRPTSQSRRGLNFYGFFINFKW